MAENNNTYKTREFHTPLSSSCYSLDGVLSPTAHHRDSTKSSKGRSALLPIVKRRGVPPATVHERRHLRSNVDILREISTSLLSRLNLIHLAFMARALSRDRQSSGVLDLSPTPDSDPSTAWLWAITPSRAALPEEECGEWTPFT